MLQTRNAALLGGLLATLLSACSSNTDAGSSPDVAAGRSNSGGNGPSPSNAGAYSAGGSLFNFGGTSGSGSGSPPPMTDVTVVITADNAYGFGYGTGSEIVSYFGGVENETSEQIFSCPIGMGPETYTVPAAQANSGDFLYVIGYADKSTTQGVIAKFFREGADPIFTGTGTWQGCATGMDFDPGSGGPTLEVINQQIAACNAGGMDPTTTSGGWVGTAPSPAGNVAFGEDNSTERDRPAPGNEFRIACEIEPGAHWMWYDWQANRTSSSPFMWPGGNGNPTKDFLIFRLTADSIPEPPLK